MSSAEAKEPRTGAGEAEQALIQAGEGAGEAHVKENGVLGKGQGQKSKGKAGKEEQRRDSGRSTAGKRHVGKAQDWQGETYTKTRKTTRSTAQAGEGRVIEPLQLRGSGRAAAAAAAAGGEGAPRPLPRRKSRDPR